jgi:hypothetical protein
MLTVEAVRSLFWQILDGDVRIEDLDLDELREVYEEGMEILESDVEYAEEMNVLPLVLHLEDLLGGGSPREARIRYGQAGTPYEPGQRVEIANSDDPSIPVGMQADVSEVLPVTDQSVREDYPSGWQVGIRNPMGGGIAYVDAGDLTRLSAGSFPVYCAWCGKIMGTSDVSGSHGICSECSNTLMESELTPEELERLELLRSHKGGGSEMRGLGSFERKVAILDRMTSRMSCRGCGRTFDRLVAQLHDAEETLYRLAASSGIRRKAKPFQFEEMDAVEDGGFGGIGNSGPVGGDEEPITPSDVDLDTIRPEHLEAIEDQVDALESELSSEDEKEAAKAVGEASEALSDAEEAMGGDTGEGKPEEKLEEEEEMEAEASFDFLNLRVGADGCSFPKRDRKKRPRK